MGMDEGLASSAYLNSLLRPQPRRESMPIMLPSSYAPSAMGGPGGVAMGGMNGMGMDMDMGIGMGMGVGVGIGMGVNGMGRERYSPTPTPTPTSNLNLFNGYQMNPSAHGHIDSNSNANGLGGPGGGGGQLRSGSGSGNGIGNGGCTKDLTRSITPSSTSMTTPQPWDVPLGNVRLLSHHDDRD